MNTVEWAGRTHAGRVRKNNEDAFSIASILATESQHAGESGSVSVLPERGLVFTVADGVGGQNAGEVASAIAASGIAEELARSADSAAPLPSRECGGRLEAAIRRTNGRIRQEAAADPERKDMAATASVLWMLGERAIFGQVGDSRLYRFRGGNFRQLSHDQSAVGRMVRSGKISESEAMVTVGKNLLDQALGVRDEILSPEIDWIEILPGDVFLLCSDGLVDRLRDDDLAASLRESVDSGPSLAAAADAFMTLADKSGSRDNVTVLLVRIGGVAPMPATPAAKEATRREKRPWTAAGIVALVVVAVSAGIFVPALFRASESPHSSERIEAVPAPDNELEEIRAELLLLRRSASAASGQIEEALRLVDLVISAPDAPDRAVSLEKLRVLLAGAHGEIAPAPVSGSSR